MKVLLTGGAGYIGSHIAVTLSMIGYEVVLFDNFCNSHKDVLEGLRKIIGKELPCIEGDIRDTNLVKSTLRDFKINAVIHLAGLKSVDESIKIPMEYYANNVQGTISLLEAMKAENVRFLVFSSSATVYGNPQYLPIDESHPTNPTNPYGRSKLYIEGILQDLANSDSDWRIICLRYFNPVGAHDSGDIGEDPHGVPNNLLPYITQVAVGRFPSLNIYGNDYLTHDGTGVRDYIHVVDLADGHLAALRYLFTNSEFKIVNLGTGVGVSVLEMVNAFNFISEKTIPCQIKSRRYGDVASCYANPRLAKELLGWQSKLGLDKICKSAWNWQKKNFQGMGEN